MNELFLLTLIANPELEEPLVDWLLKYEARYGFTSSRIHGHSSRLEGLSLGEQVAGRKRQLRFQLCIDQETLNFLLGQLRVDFNACGIRYWVVPVMMEGEV